MVLRGSSAVILIPVRNEEANIADLHQEIRARHPNLEICWIDDGSTDDSLREIRRTGDRYLSLPCNLGVGGAMQTGFRYALEQGFDYALRLDGDGQHPPAECARLIERMAAGDVDVVIGSRFLAGGYEGAWHRSLGIRILSWFLSRICRRKITDPTSGFQMANRAAMTLFAAQYPTDYPEPEALALLSRQGYRFAEVATAFRARRRGRSSLQGRAALYFAFQVFLALFVDRLRDVNPRLARHRLEGRI